MDLDRALELAAQGDQIEQLAGDYYEVIGPKKKADRESGKVFLVPVKRAHDLGESPATLRELIAAENFHRTGFSRAQPKYQDDLNELADFISKNIMQSSISSIGSGGARTTPTEAERLMRTAKLLRDVKNGFSSVTGQAYAGVALDAGHDESHASNPEKSNDPKNIAMENQYMNKAKSAAEKRAFQDGGRQATQEELADAIFKSFINKITSNVKLPPRNTKAGKAEYDAMMARIDAKLRSRKRT